MPQIVETERYNEIKYGLITPAGNLYECGVCGHSDLVYELIEAGELVKSNARDYRGAVHVSEFTFDKIQNARDVDKRYAHYYKDALFVTQKQIDTMMDYLIANDKRFEFEGLNIIE